MRAAVVELGRFPSRRRYDLWREQWPNATELASATLIRKVFDNSWRKALEAAGAPQADVTARRLLSNGRAFRPADRRLALRLFAAAVPPGQRTQRAYTDWARAYVLDAGATDIPTNAKSFTKRPRAKWFEVLMDAGMPNEAAARAPLSGGLREGRGS
jgi:hypothetical protein